MSQSTVILLLSQTLSRRGEGTSLWFPHLPAEITARDWAPGADIPDHAFSFPSEEFHELLFLLGGFSFHVIVPGIIFATVPTTVSIISSSKLRVTMPEGTLGQALQMQNVCPGPKAYLRHKITQGSCPVMALLPC